MGIEKFTDEVASSAPNSSRYRHNDMEQDDPDSSSDSTSDSDSDSDFESCSDLWSSNQQSAMRTLQDFPDGLKTAKPLITAEELEYGVMEMVQNPWEYIDGSQLLPSVRAFLTDASGKHKTYLSFS